MKNSTQTAHGEVPHLNCRGHRYPIVVEITTMGRLPAAKTNKHGFGLYALPGGGEATADQIRAMKAS